MRKNVYGIKNFTSYFDRKVMRLSSFEEYVSGRDYWFTEQVSFALNDGISTSVVFNLNSDEQEDIELGGIPNYVIVCDASRKVLSRWYVTEGRYVRETQYELSLRRDVIADYMDEVLTSVCMVDRAPLPPSSPLLYNREDMAFNQIKVSETLIKDETRRAWIVGYVSDDTTDTSTVVADTDQSQTSSYPTLAQALPGIEWDDPSDPSKGGTFEGCVSQVDYATSARLYNANQLTGVDYKCFYLHSIGSGLGSIEEIFGWQQGFRNYAVKHGLTDYRDVWGSAEVDGLSWISLVETHRGSLDSDFSNVNGVGTNEEYLDVLAANGRVFYDSVNQKYYRLTVTQTATRTLLDSCPIDGMPSLRARLISLSRMLCEGIGSNAEYNDEGYVQASATVATVRVYGQEVSVDGQLKTTMVVSRRKLTDAPYDMFCLELNGGNLALAQRIVSAPPAEGTVKKIYDLQILPYCPRRDIVPSVPGDPLDDSGLTEGVDYQKIYETSGGSDVEVGKLYWCVKSSYSFFVSLDDPVVIPGGISSSIGKKLSDLCDLYRLSSPNYAASFDISAAKNGGISRLKIDFTYRPVMPYIHVAPVFSGLYGSFNNDARGLICGGDFSVDMISDPWTEYMSNNKNYENIFNTQIKKLDAFREYDRGALALSGIMATAGATAAGAMKGGLAGAAVGFAAGAARSIGQAVVSEGKYQAERKAMIDTFSYELGNVRAAPDSLTKVSAYNVNNKYFPVLEKYTATEEEKEAARRYFELYNFKVGVVGTLAHFLDQGRTKTWEYVRGQVVLLPPTAKSEDSHFLSEAYAEIEKGVFIYG